MMRSLVDTWGLVERRGKRGNTRYTLSAEGIRYITHRDRAQLPTTRGIWSTALTTDRQGRTRHVGHRIDTWVRQPKHADGITWFLSKLEAEARADPDSELLWSVPTAGSDRAYNWGQSAIAPRRRWEDDGRGPSDTILPRVRASRPSPQGSPDPPESLHELLLVYRARRRPATVPRHALRRRPRGRRGNLREHSGQDEPDALPIFVSCIPALSNTGILGRSWRPLWEPESPRLPLSELRFYQWDSLYHRMRHRPCRGGIDRADASLSPCWIVWGVQTAGASAIVVVCRHPNRPVLATKRADASPERSAFAHADKWESALK